MQIERVQLVRRSKGLEAGVSAVQELVATKPTPARVHGAISGMAERSRSIRGGDPGSQDRSAGR